MDVVSISQFYPCSKVSLAAELYYICELSKYLYYYHDSQLSVDGVQFDPILKKSDVFRHFRVAVLNGWLVDANIPSNLIDVSADNPLVLEPRTFTNILFTEDDVSGWNFDKPIRFGNNLDAGMYAPEVRQVIFPIRKDIGYDENGRDLGITYCMLLSSSSEGSNVNNVSIRTRGDHNLLWVSLYAYVAVKRLYTRVRSLLVEFDSMVVLDTFELSYTMLLFNETQCLYGWFYYKYNKNVSPKDAAEVGYRAWYKKGFDMGMLRERYSVKTKLALLKKLGIRKGDVFLLFEREKEQEKNFIKSINGCHICILRDIVKDKKGMPDIVYDKLICPNIRDQKVFEYKNLTMAKKMMFASPESYYGEIKVEKRKRSLTGTGVEYATLDELDLIVPLSETEDEQVSKVNCGGTYVDVYLPQNDFIYWVLKDYNFEFNEEHFIEQFFHNTTPLWKVHLDTDTVPVEYIVT